MEVNSSPGLEGVENATGLDIARHGIHTNISKRNAKTQRDKDQRQGMTKRDAVCDCGPVPVEALAPQDIRIPSAPV